MPIELPWNKLREPVHEWNIAAATYSPGQTAAGNFPFGRLDGGGLWVATISDIKLRTRNDVLLWRAVRQVCQGGVTPIVVPRRETLTPPFPTIGGRRLTGYGDVPHDDGALFDDDSGYYQPVIFAETVGAAALRATSLTIAFTADTSDPLLGGEAFSIKHPAQDWHLYEVKSVEIDDDDNSVVVFEPPLREAVADATRLEFDRPRCVMRLRTPNAMDLQLRIYPYGSATMSFVEYIYPETD